METTFFHRSSFDQLEPEPEFGQGVSRVEEARPVRKKPNTKFGEGQAVVVGLAPASWKYVFESIYETYFKKLRVAKNRTHIMIEDDLHSSVEILDDLSSLI